MFPSKKTAAGIAHPRFGLLAVVFATCLGLPRQGESAEATQWIWGSRDHGSFETIESFDLPGSIKSARLRCAVDFCTAKVWLNDQVAWSFAGENNLAKVDASALLQPGSNRLRVLAERTAGPAAIAYELKVVLADGKERIVRSQQRSASDPANASSRQVFGDLAVEPWWNIVRSPQVGPFDEYNQWKEAVSGSAAKELASFQVAAGFEIELVYRARPSDGSWVSLEIDKKGRFLLGREDLGIMRLTLPQDGQGEVTMERLNATLLGVQGLLLTDQGLIASANHSKGLYRLNHNTGGHSFGKVTLLRRTEGGKGDHGRHAVVQDDQGRLYVIHGDSVQIPEGFNSLVPATNEFQDKRPEDGHVIQTDVHGERWNVFCAGLRNPYGLARNNAGELFTYDADAERHTGLPWYRPTRILHLMPGVDYGWRNPGIPWPGYLPDTIPPAAKIGRGSPTALKFAAASHFPPAYRKALFALDWSFGRILAVHLVPQGSTYQGQAEVFVRGRPFSVCDLDFAADGSMYVVTGGRDTKSSLYRIRHTPRVSPTLPDSPQVNARTEYSRRMRAQRRELESLFARPGPDGVRQAWQHLAHPDAGIRSAARILLEHQQPVTWQDRLWNESQPERALPALLALVRIGDSESFPRIHDKLHSLNWSGSLQLQTAIRIESLIDKHSPPSARRSARIRARLDASFPSGQRAIDRQLCQLLIKHNSQHVVQRTLDLLASEPDQIDKFHYLVCLADATAGWTAARHDEFFRLLSAARLFITDEGLEDRLQELFDKAIGRAPESQQASFRAVFASSSQSSDVPTQQLPLIHRWTVQEILQQLERSNHKPSAANGAQVFKLANCSRCHRFATIGRPFGPDLSTVAARFSRSHLLRQIVEPSKTLSSQYLDYAIELNNGKTINGQVVYNGFRKSILRVATNPMALHETIEIKKEEIESFRESGVSPMPERLLDGLSVEQIADLLAYLEAGGR